MKNPAANSVTGSDEVSEGAGSPPPMLITVELPELLITLFELEVFTLPELLVLLITTELPELTMLLFEVAVFTPPPVDVAEVLLVID